MPGQPNRGPVVVDTDVYSARLLPNSALARRYEPLLVGRVEFVSFQTVAEVRYGALLRDWGTARLRRMEAEIARTEIEHSGGDPSASTAIFASPANEPDTPSASASTTPTDGSPPPRSASASLSSPTTESSRTRPDSRSRPPDAHRRPAHICVDRKGGLVRDAPTAGTTPGRGPRLRAGGGSVVR